MEGVLKIVGVVTLLAILHGLLEVRRRQKNDTE